MPWPLQARLPSSTASCQLHTCHVCRRPHPSLSPHHAEPLSAASVLTWFTSLVTSAQSHRGWDSPPWLPVAETQRLCTCCSIDLECSPAGQSPHHSVIPFRPLLQCQRSPAHAHDAPFAAPALFCLTALLPSTHPLSPTRPLSPPHATPRTDGRQLCEHSDFLCHSLSSPQPLGSTWHLVGAQKMSLNE